MIFAYNLNSEIIFRIDDNNNVGFGLFYGSVLWRDTGSSEVGFVGSTLKYRYKKITLSFINELGLENISSSKIGITYRILNKKAKKR